MVPLLPRRGHDAVDWHNPSETPFEKMIESYKMLDPIKIIQNHLKSMEMSLDATLRRALKLSKESQGTGARIPDDQISRLGRVPLAVDSCSSESKALSSLGKSSGRRPRGSQKPGGSLAQ